MINQEIIMFCQNWQEKADKIDDSILSGAFDKFFTLYVVYNRLYIEITFIMINKGEINLPNRTVFPDYKAAKDYVVQYLSSIYINNQLNADKKYIDAIESLKKILKHNHFSIKLNQITGMLQPDKDYELLKRLESTQTNKKITAITDFIYSIRCNIFHAQKGYDNDQINILKPINILLAKFNEMLFDKLRY